MSQLKTIERLSRLFRRPGHVLDAQNGGALGCYPTAQGLTVVHLVQSPDQPPTITFRALLTNGAGADRELVQQLKQHGIKKERSCTVLNPESYQIFQEESVKAPMDELAEMMRWRIKDRLQFPVDKAQVIILDGGPTAHDTKPTRPLLHVAAVPVETVAGEVSRLDTAPVRIQSIAGFETAWSNLITLLPQKEGDQESGHALIHISEERTSIMIYRHGGLQFVRRISMGSNLLGNIAEGADPDLPIIPEIALEEWIREVKRTFDFYKKRYQSAVPQTIHTTPLVAEAQPFIQLLTEKLDQAVVSLTPDHFEGLCQQDIPAEESLNCLTAVGAALEVLNAPAAQRNFLTRAQRPESAWPNASWIPVGAVAASLLVAMASGWFQLSNDGMEESLSQLKAQEKVLFDTVTDLAKKQKNEQEAIFFQQRIRKIEKRIRHDQQLLTYLHQAAPKSSGSFDRHFSDLANYRIEGVWLTELWIHDGGKKVMLRGNTITPDQVPHYVTKLGESDSFKQRRFQLLSLEKSKTQGRETHQFSIKTKKMERIYLAERSDNQETMSQ